MLEKKKIREQESKQLELEYKQKAENIRKKFLQQYEQSEQAVR